VRDALVAALAACANNLPSRWRTRRFLTGLSGDELQFIAEYLGSRILGSWGGGQGVENRSAEPGVAACRSRDREHKMILLMEFLGRSGIRPANMRAHASRWN
jgi:hypothetical protein